MRSSGGLGNWRVLCLWTRDGSCVESFRRRVVRLG